MLLCRLPVWFRFDKLVHEGSKKLGVLGGVRAWGFGFLIIIDSAYERGALFFGKLLHLPGVGPDFGSSDWGLGLRA